MDHFFKRFVLLLSLGVPLVVVSAPPELAEVLTTLQSNLPSISQAELQQAALEGLIEKLKHRVQVLPPAEKPANPAPDSTLATNAVFDNEYGYIRVVRVDQGLSAQLSEAAGKLAEHRKLKGLILDLRFAQGVDYQEAVSAAALFTDHRSSLVIDGEEIPPQTNAQPIRHPAVVLVNESTAGAAEALAALMRDHRTAILIGSPTAGQATAFKTHKLSTGHLLLVASSPVRLSDSTNAPLQKIKPDITVGISPMEEKLYLENPYLDLALTNRSTSQTNLSGIPRLNEAELVRQRRSIDGDSSPSGVSRPGPAAAVVRDPALARGLDLLKGLALVTRSSAGKER